MRRKLTSFIIISFLFVCLSWIGLWANVLSRVENGLWDMRLRSIDLRYEPDARIKLVMIDQASLDAYAGDFTWPWPRSVYAAVLKFLERAGAKGVAFDLIFTETSTYGVEEDQTYAQALGKEFPVISALALTDKERELDSARQKLFQARQAERVRDSDMHSLFLGSARVQRYPSVILPVSQILERSYAFGSVAGSPDEDGIFRHYRPGGIWGDTPVLSLAFALYESTAGGGVYLADTFGSLLDEDGQLTVAFTGPENTYPYFNIQSVLKSFELLEEGEQPLIPLSEFKDAYVFVGANAAGILDLRPTPLSKKYPGVEYHATAFDNLLNQRFIREGSLPANIAYAAVFIVVCSGLTVLLPQIRIQILGMALALFLFFQCGVLLALNGIRINMGVPLVALIGTIVSSLAYRYYLEGGEYRFIKRAFSQYLSPDVVNQIARSPHLLQLGGERKRLTLFFSDIEGFTTISETLEPQKLSALLNRFLSLWTEIILEHGGTLDKYIGDAIVAFWGAPLAVEDHGERAVQAAFRCQAALDQVRVALASEFGVMLRARIGIHSGDVVVGNFGSSRRFAYTVIGDSANLASRLEGLNKTFGTYIVISKSTRDTLDKSIYCRRLGTVKVVGKAEAVEIFEPLRDVNAETQEMQQFAEAVQLFERAELEAALQCFKNLSKDPVSQRFARRIERDLALFQSTGGISRKLWSPVWNMVEK